MKTFVMDPHNFYKLLSQKNQNEILKILDRSDDELLTLKVRQRKFKVKYLLEGVIQHDIYHIGQIAALNKTLQNNM